MADWQQYFQSVFFGIIFSFLLAKLFSVIFAFREENLRITRSLPSESEPDARVLEEEEPLIEEKAKSGTEGSSDICDYVDSEDDDWEGVESTELDETFSAATAFVAATAVDRAALKVSNDVQLQLYGLYKIATEGPCSSPQPSALKMTARAKWQAWQKLGAMPPEEAMEKYIDIVTKLYPSWADGAVTKKRDKESSDASSASAKGPMGPVFSTFVYEEDSGNDLKLDDIHVAAQEGEEEKLLKCIASGASLNEKDSEGRTALHWTVDRGHMDIAMVLLSKNADINAESVFPSLLACILLRIHEVLQRQPFTYFSWIILSTKSLFGEESKMRKITDNEGQTPLHYAALCERFDLAEFLVKHGADIGIKDNEGNTPADLCESSRPWLRGSS